MDEIFQSLQEHFGRPENNFSFEELIGKLSAVNAESVKAYCAGCIAMVQSMDLTDFEKAIMLLDSVLILSGPNDDIQKLLKLYCSNTIMDLMQYPTDFLNTPRPIPVSTLPAIADPSIKEFIDSRLRPFVSTEIMSSWAALDKWKNPRYWLQVAGERYFPMEIGETYLEADWHQEFIQLKAYLDSFVFCLHEKSLSKIAYIAQHNWLYQLPELQNDFEVPELCDLFLDEALPEVMIHFWFGMAGTVTPLHFDKYDNFFCQVVGEKKVILVNPEYSNLLSDGSDNTCPLTGTTLEALLQTIPHEIVTVVAGQMLFIPKGWWHKVRSLTFSISLSFWF